MNNRLPAFHITEPSTNGTVFLTTENCCLHSITVLPVPPHPLAHAQSVAGSVINDRRVTCQIIHYQTRTEPNPLRWPGPMDPNESHHLMNRHSDPLVAFLCGKANLRRHLAQHGVPSIGHGCDFLCNSSFSTSPQFTEIVLHKNHFNLPRSDIIVFDYFKLCQTAATVVILQIALNGGNCR